MYGGKRAAGEYAASLVESGMTLGLGTGSTTEHFLRALGERIRSGGLHVRGVPTSRATEASAARHGIPVVGLDVVTHIDMTVDGADEVDPALRMIKGGGGALLREKVVAKLSQREVIVVDAAKLVLRLGAAFPLPIEVVPFALPYVRRALERYGSVRPRLRDNQPYVTDNGNFVVDLRFPHGIDDAPGLDAELSSIAGVVETGLFIDVVDRLVVGRDDGTIEVRDRPTPAT